MLILTDDEMEEYYEALNIMSRIKSSTEETSERKHNIMADWMDLIDVEKSNKQFLEKKNEQTS